MARTGSAATAEEFGIRDEKGHWRPPYPVRYAPLLTWPPRPLAFLRWLFDYPGFLWPINLAFLGLAVVSWYFLQPPLSQTAQLRFGWIALMLLRNLGLMWLVAGGHHLAFYTLRLQGNQRKYHPEWLSPNSKKYLFGSQTWDNIVRSCLSGCTIWTAYEVLYFWGAANGWFPYLSLREHPGWFVAVFFLIPLWRETHFFVIHRLLHWRPLMRAFHRVHHFNPNPGPWSGMAMHPVEHLVYLSVVAIHFVVPSHPIHFFFNSQLTALTPAIGHVGFEGPVFGGWFMTGSYFHYLHHRFVTCNYGEATVPLDKWTGTFFDGEGSYSAWQRKGSTA
jgi:sterol desaturase/sphingolipid hydroxylase (fatty acid hydroxylase superfamily)